MTSSTSATPRTALAVRGVRKSFAGARALGGLNLDLRAGEVHALVGGNGSGKSTLIKILAGVHTADAGTAEIDGTELDLTAQTPAVARAAGLRFVHQDLGIFPILSVAENLAIGRGFQQGLGGRIRWRACRAEAHETLSRFNVDVDPGAPAASLSTPQRAMLAIARALQSIDEDARGVLVLDEPTASLPPEEATLLLGHVRDLAVQGHTVLLVTHRLDEVQRAADRVTGVRDGVGVGTIDAREMTEEDVVQLILARRLERADVAAPVAGRGSPVLELRGVRSGPLRGVDLTVNAGEVVGVAGLLGSGRTELLETIFGARRLESGEVLVGDHREGAPSPRRMRDLGVAFVPEDRQSEAVFPDQDVTENMTAGHVGSYFRAGWLRDRPLKGDVRGDIGRFAVKTHSEQAKIETLSGGNQQKVMLARWLRDDPTVILLDEPTQGIDVGAREEIFALIARATEGGAGVLLVSSEFEELARLSHRTLVLSGGHIVQELGPEATSHAVLQAVLEHARSLSA